MIAVPSGRQKRNVAPVNYSDTSSTKRVSSSSSASTSNEALFFESSSSNGSPRAVATGDEGDDGFVRRSSRDPTISVLETGDVQNCLRKIREQHEDTVVLKIKDQIRADINPRVLDSIWDVLYKNKVCQALYCQNLSDAMLDTQLFRLIEILKLKRIWALNIGENYKITPSGWAEFEKALPDTWLTHIYISEHVIPLTQKNKIRDLIRENRKKHTKHSSTRNISVIQRCTNLWWNPINTIKHRMEAKIARKENEKEQARLERQRLADEARRKALVAKARALRAEGKKLSKKMSDAIAEQGKGGKTRGLVSGFTKDELCKEEWHPLYWAEGFGKGGDGGWKFKCICGELCSSWENPLYHPIGRQYECTACHTWGHVKCMYGERTTDRDLDERGDLLCYTCTAVVRRRLKGSGGPNMTIEQLIEQAEGGGSDDEGGGDEEDGDEEEQEGAKEQQEMMVVVEREVEEEKEKEKEEIN